MLLKTLVLFLNVQIAIAVFDQSDYADVTTFEE